MSGQLIAGSNPTISESETHKERERCLRILREHSRYYQDSLSNPERSAEGKLKDLCRHELCESLINAIMNPDNGIPS